MKWADGLDIPTVEENPDFELLWWVGCAPAYDMRAQSTAHAFYEVLKAANVNFAILGEMESCTGDSARRSGNEALFYELAMALIFCTFQSVIIIHRIELLLFSQLAHSHLPSPYSYSHKTSSTLYFNTLSSQYLSVLGASTHQALLVDPSPAFDLHFSFQSCRAVGQHLPIDKIYRPMLSRVAGAAPGVVLSYPTLKVDCPASIQGAICTADDVDVGRAVSRWMLRHSDTVYLKRTCTPSSERHGMSL